ncbi:MAG: LysM peptidoglycan-binding domain-containing protein [Microbacteriaceae bacterium]
MSRSLFSTVPIVLVGTMAMSLNLTGPLSSAHAIKRPAKAKSSPADFARTIRTALANAGVRAGDAGKLTTATVSTAAMTPITYRVGAGDTVSAIAAKYGLSTASVLALNGLGWKSIIFPGQILRLATGQLPTPAPEVSPPSSTPAGVSRYTIAGGDTVSRIAARFGVSTQSVLTANGLGWTSLIYPGQVLTIPGSPSPAQAAGETPSAMTPVSMVTPVVSTPSPVTNPPAATASTTYTIKSGDTVSRIAASFGVTVPSILKANGLGWSSIIYPGRTLTIPGVTIASSGQAILLLSDEMSRNATIIIRVGRSLGVSDYGLVIALAAAMQESGLRNLPYGDLDSLGLFQQRPSAGWGTPKQIMDPVYASRKFFGGPSNPNPGINRGLLDIPGWQSMTVTQAAQAVQISAYPNAYARWEASARSWLAQLR